jgi:hypothetical protein
MIVEEILSNPVYVGILTVVIIVGVYYQKRLGYTDYRVLHSLKSVLFRAFDSRARSAGRPLVRYKHFGDNEFVTRVETSPRKTFQKLREGGFSPHLIATLKVRKNKTREQVAHSQLVYTHSDGMQTEAYLFAHNDGTDVYGHVETSVVDVEGHLTDPQTDGDARDVIKNALEDV